MNFYRTLSNYYDQVFPAGQTQLTFFKALFQEHKVKSVLDVACGTGSYSLELAKWGLTVLGTDLSVEMIEQARVKAAQEQVEAEFLVADMRYMPEFNQLFDAVICIGNSIVHLLTSEDILKVLRYFAGTLQTKGLLVLQTVNYDRILDQKISGLPTIQRPEAKLNFERNYHLRNDGLIDFESILSVDGQVMTSTVPLLPLRRAMMQELLVEAGFEVIAVYGGFNKAPMDDRAQALVLVAQKLD